jgi:hypothetical protein
MENNKDIFVKTATRNLLKEPRLTISVFLQIGHDTFL